MFQTTITVKPSCSSDSIRLTGKLKILPVVIFSFNNRRHALTAADTGIGAAIATALGFQDTGQGSGQTNTGGSQGMPDGRAAAHHIDGLRFESQFGDTIERYNGKGLVELPEVDIRGFKPFS